MKKFEGIEVSFIPATTFSRGSYVYHGATNGLDVSKDCDPFFILSKNGFELKAVCQGNYGPEFYYQREIEE